MADNVAITPGTGATVAADDIGGVLFQRVKLTAGTDGTATDVSATDPLPVVQTGTPALPTGAATAANQSTGNTSLASILAKLSADPATQTTLAAILAKLTADPSTATNQSSELTLVGGVTETAPASDTASSGLNGRLQRIAQRVSSLIALLPTALGGAGGLKVEQVAALPAGTNNIGHVGGTESEPIAASQTDQVIGPTGAAGDYLSGVLIVPGTTSPGAVAVKDGTGSAVTIFAGGPSSVGSLVSFFVPYPAKSGSGAWKVTTGANVSAVAFGDFT